MELQGFYNNETDSTLRGGGEGSQHLKGGSPFLLHAVSKPAPTTPILKFHNHFPPDASPVDKKDSSLLDDGVVFSPPPKRAKLLQNTGMTATGIPPLNERVMLYVRQEPEAVYTPLHVVPPTTEGLLNAVSIKTFFLIIHSISFYLSYCGLVFFFTNFKTLKFLQTF